MILSHFTFDKHVQSILKNGILPGSRHDHLTDGRPCAWLTSATEPNWSDTDVYHHRIKLIIPSNDRRLAKWKKWARRHCPDVLDEVVDSLMRCTCGMDHGAMLATTWCFFGTVPTTMIRSVERARGGGVKRKQLGAIR